MSRTPEGSVRFSLLISEEQKTRLDQLSNDLIVSKGLLVRHAIDALLGDAPQFGTRRRCRRWWLRRIGKNR